MGAYRFDHWACGGGLISQNLDNARLFLLGGVPGFIATPAIAWLARVVSYRGLMIR